MNIAIDLSGFVLGKAVGFNEYVLSLMEGFEDQGDVFITIYVQIGQEVYFKKRPNLIIRTIRISNDYSRLLWHHCVLPFRARSYDLMVFPANFTPLIFPFKHIVVVHDLNYLSNPDSFPKIMLYYRRLLAGRSIKKASKVIAISEATGKEIEKYFGVQADVIHNPVRLVKVSESANDKMILCPSSLAEYKNVPAAYDALERFVNTHCDYSAVFIGNWSSDQFPVKRNHDKISLLGFVDDNEKYALLSKACCLLVPSLYEGFGMPYVEAVLYEKALVCSHLSVAEEVVGEYPYWIEYPYSTDKIYDALCVAYDDGFAPKRVPFGFIERYVPSNVFGKYISIIKSVL